MNKDWSERDIELIFHKPLSEFSDKDWEDLYKALDKDKEEKEENNDIKRAKKR